MKSPVQKQVQGSSPFNCNKCIESLISNIKGGTKGGLCILLFQEFQTNYKKIRNKEVSDFYWIFVFPIPLNPPLKQMFVLQNIFIFKGGRTLRMNNDYNNWAGDGKSPAQLQKKESTRHPTYGFFLITSPPGRQGRGSSNTASSLSRFRGFYLVD